jgi:succinoglycan biosynthesis transport protein ExoP
MNQMTKLPFNAAAGPDRTAFGAGSGMQPPHAWQAPEPTPEIVEIWRAVMQRKWAILLLGLLAAAIAAFVVTQIKPTYQSSATVLLEAAPTKVVSQIEDVYSGVGNNREHFQTQAEVMKSRDVALRVIERLRLTEHPEFDPRQQATPAWREWLAKWATPA